MKSGVVVLVCLVFLFGSVGVVALTTISKTAEWISSDSSCMYLAGDRGVLSSGIDSENPSSTDCGQFNYIDLEESTEVKIYSSSYSSGDHACVYECPLNYGLVRVYAENPSSPSDCSRVKCMYIGSGGEVSSLRAVWSLGDHACQYYCPAGSALRKFYAENPSGSSDCNAFSCQAINLPPPSVPLPVPPEDTSQIIMKLFRPSDSYGALWNDTVYGYNIYYDKIFSTPYGEANPHDCTGDNKVVGLLDITDAHAEIPSGTTAGYDTDVCYGDLSCIAKDNTCGTNEKMIVALNETSDSNITDPNYMPNGMVSWWRFDNENVNDWVGNNEGELKNGAGFVNSKIGKGLSLDGVDDYVEVADDDSLNLTKYSVEAWFNLSRLPDDGETFVILGKGEGPGTDKYNYHMTVMNDTSKWTPPRNSSTIHCAFESSSDIDYNILFDIDDSYVGRYVHVVCTLSGDSFNLYVDGVNRTSSSFLYDNSANIISSNPPIGGFPVPTFTTAPLTIGAVICGTSPGCVNGVERNFFPGQIDEVAIYNRSLTLEEVQHRYNMGMYEKKICCSKDTGSQVWWENMDGEVITETCLGSSVRMVQSYSSSGDFEIFENDPSGDDTIREGVDNISGVVDGDELRGIWRITPEDFNKGVNGESDELDDGHIEAFFKVNGLGSGYLNISDEYCDEDMVVTLMSPDCGEDFTKGVSSSDIKINASDPNDLITGNVSVDGEVFDFTNGVIIIPHKWERSGNLQIELFAINSKGYMMRKITSVMVVDPDLTTAADYVAACIDKPADFSDITSRNVWFDASGSRGLKCSSGTNCVGVEKKDLWFSWRFSDGLINFNHDGENELSYQFFKNFATSGHNWAILDVEIRDS